MCLYRIDYILVDIFLALIFLFFWRLYKFCRWILKPYEGARNIFPTSLNMATSSTEKSISIYIYIFFSNRQIVTSEKTLIWHKDRPNMGQWNDDHLLVARRQSSYKHGSRDGPLQAEEHAARDTEREQWQCVCLSGANYRRLVETSNVHEYTKTSMRMAVQCNQLY